MIIITGSLFAQIDYKGFPQWSWHKQDSTEYYLYTPDATSKNGRYPIVLFLHGCCGESYHATLRNTVDPPVRMWHNFGANEQQEPTYIIAPATSHGWRQHIKNLKQVMDDLVKNHHGDPQRIYITGFSMGGDGTWEFIQQYPNYFAAALPMGMNFHGDHDKIKDVPIWTNRGETDYHARFLQKDVWEIRKLNGDNVDSNENWVTGVNPRFTSFKDYGHGVQWVAASTQDLTGWAYSKVNDGNKYPVVFFESPSYKHKVGQGAAVLFKIHAADSDGSISKVEIKVNGRHHSTLTKQPYTVSVTAPRGDATIEAIAFDNKGKSSTATTVVRSDIKTKLLSPGLPYAQRGALYEKKLFAQGNGVIRFFVTGGALPKGLTLKQNGLLAGVPETAGTFNVVISATDEDGDSSSSNYSLIVTKKRPEEILVTNVVNDSGVVFPVSKMRIGVSTHFDRDDDEVTISNTNGYDGITFIPGNNRDTNRTNNNYLSFDVDDDARVYVAYEKKDFQFASTIPAWLSDWQKDASGQIVAQYFYYDVYFKDFPKGKVTLPGTDERKNNVGNNYFVMVRKALAPYTFAPEINAEGLNPAFLLLPYEEQLGVLYGKGILKWQLIKGKLPVGLKLSENGRIEGVPESKGTYQFTARVKDANDNAAVRDFTIAVK